MVPEQLCPRHLSPFVFPEVSPTCLGSEGLLRLLPTGRGTEVGFEGIGTAPTSVWSKPSGRRGGPGPGRGFSVTVTPPVSPFSSSRVSRVGPGRPVPLSPSDPHTHFSALF